MSRYFAVLLSVMFLGVSTLCPGYVAGSVEENSSEIITETDGSQFLADGPPPNIISKGWKIYLEEVLELKNLKGSPISRAIFSPSGKQLLVNSENGRGLLIYDIAKKNEFQVSSAPGSGYGASWSPGGDRIAYKEVDPDSGGEKPVIYDIKANHSFILDKKGKYCGTPVFSRSGQVGVTAEKYIYLYGEKLTPEKVLSLKEPYHQMAFSPDGASVVLVTGSGILLMNIKGTRKKPILLSKELEYMGPQFSPDGKKLLLRTATGNLVVVDISSGKITELGRGRDAQWFSDSNNIIYLRNRRMLIDGENRSEIIIRDVRGKREHSVLDPDWEIISGLSFSREGSKIACVSGIDESIKIFKLTNLK